MQDQLLQKMSRIAREELRHFEQVLAIMQKRKIVFKKIASSRYAKGLMKFVRVQAKERLIDWLIIGALVEARSCERFAALVPYLDDELSKFYQGLVNAEKRHFLTYLQFAENLAEDDISQRIDFFKEEEMKLIMAPDEQFRFHSGIPIRGM